MESSVRPEVVLVYPPYEDVMFHGGAYFTSIPLGVAYLAAVLEESGISVSVIDCSVEKVDVGGLARRILDAKPKVLGISVTSLSLRFVKRLIDEVREGGRTSTIPKIAVGGPHIGADTGSSLLLGADVCFSGEADYSFAEYCKGVIDGGDGVSGIINCGLVNDINHLPYPARHLFDEKRYRFVPIMASRGCPCNCMYCGMAGTPYRKRGLDSIRGEVEGMSRGRCLISLDFADDVFTLDRQHTMEIADLMEEYNLSWACTTRADMVEGELLRYMGKRGCRHISFGVESGSEEIRALVGKNVPDKAYVKAFKGCREAGIMTRAYIMVGFPGETRRDMERTISFTNSLKPDSYGYAMTIVLPNTRLMDYCVSKGLIRENYWVGYMRGNAGVPYFLPEGVVRSDIDALAYRQSKRFYLNPRHIALRMKNAKNAGELTDSLKAWGVYLADLIFNRTY
ncbi:MAG: radical SAM protein [Candidatus Altiarchaeota archaeon]